MNAKYTGKKKEEVKTRRKEAQTNLTASSTIPSKVPRVILKRRLTDVRGGKVFCRVRRSHEMR
jgi:hypothetical protein